MFAETVRVSKYLAASRHGIISSSDLNTKFRSINYSYNHLCSYYFTTNHRLYFKYIKVSVFMFFPFTIESPEIYYVFVSDELYLTIFPRKARRFQGRRPRSATSGAASPAIGKMHLTYIKCDTSSIFPLIYNYMDLSLIFTVTSGPGFGTAQSQCRTASPALFQHWHNHTQWLYEKITSQRLLTLNLLSAYIAVFCFSVCPSRT